MDLNLLAVFEAVARTRSFSAAARELRLPKSSVSRGVARLESELRLQLLFRTTRHVSLTAAGTALYDRVTPLLASMRAAIAEAPEGEEPTGALRVTAPADIGSYLLAEVVTRYTTRHPAVSVELSLTGRIVDLVAEGFDLALRAAPSLRDSTLVARKVASMTVQLFASPLYLARRGTPRTEADLASHDGVIFASASGGTPLQASRGVAELAPRARIRCDDLLFVREALRAGAGLGLLPAFVADADVAAGTLVRVLPRFERPAGNLYIVSPATRHVPRKVTAFRDLVIELLAARRLPPGA